jgi:cyclomaltodextrinase / maltogenic alpha-amylase / neopullulanase
MGSIDIQHRGIRCGALAALTIAVIAVGSVCTAGVAITTPDATVWARSQWITGRVDSGMAPTGSLLVNGRVVPFVVPAGSDTFSVRVELSNGTNTLVALSDSNGVQCVSDTVRLVLGYRLRPEIAASIDSGSVPVRLHATVLENPDSALLTFAWDAEAANPVPVTITHGTGGTASASLPSGAPPGEYVFRVTVATNGGDTVRARAALVVDSSGIRPFNPVTDRSRWIDSAIVYGITPSIFVFEGRFGNITAKLPDLVQLGVNTLWLQPVYATYRKGQGYDVTDFFKVRSDLGTAAELRTLINTAHALGLRVLFDFVPNHTSIFHPYAQNSVTLGQRSHYYTFYQRTTDAAPYAQHYQKYQGFINYFWNELPNLNYDHPEVQRMITEAARYWVEQFDIDGYRVDVAWGPAARKPEFFQAWRLALKRLKPQVLLLGEDKATWPSVFDGRFDAAYDWAPEQSWVSHWVWQTSYSTSGNPTVFNSSNQNQRSALLRASITNSGSGYAAGAKIFRFLENNDTFRFLATHDLARTKMAAALMFTLPGIPSVFNGQEIGAATHPYSASTIFSPTRSIPAQDQYGLYSFYSLLAGIRKRFPALRSSSYAEVPVSPGGAVFAYHRWEGNQRVFVVLNMGGSEVTAYLSIPASGLGLDTARTYYLTDQLTNHVVAATPGQLETLAVPMPAYTARVYVLGTEPVTSVLPPGTDLPAMPGTIALEQNYPNPFNPVTTIRYQMPNARHLNMSVYDVLGREVAVLVNGVQNPGMHTATFDGSQLPSGVYFCRMQSDSWSQTIKLMLVK